VAVEGSPRFVNIDDAKKIFAATEPDTIRVLVFKKEKPERILQAAESASTKHVQTYGLPEDEVLWLEKAGMTVFRVFGIAPTARRLPPLSPQPSKERPAVLDVGGGGSGTSFSWEILGGSAPPATFIAGGVRPENILDLMKHRPYGVDLSSGVETSPGIKDFRRLRLFFENLEKSL
jgi:phosphoribosylanthranilate isomerase